MARLISLLSLLCIIYSINSMTQNTVDMKMFKDLFGGLMGNRSVSISSIANSLQMPGCMQQCLPSMDTVSTLFKGNPNPTTVTKICGEIDSISSCARTTGCNATLLNVASKAYKFLCADNLKALPEAMICIQKSLPDLQPVCSSECGFTGNQQSQFVNSSTNLDMKALCGSSVCLLQCAKKHLETVCSLSESAILDVIFENAVDTKEHAMNQLLGWMLPSQCNEVVKMELQKKPLPLNNRPLSVGKTIVPRPVKTSSNVGNTKSSFVHPVESSAMFHGQIGSLQCQFIDYDHVPVEMADFQDVVDIVQKQFLPYFDKTHSMTDIPVVVETDLTKMNVETTHEGSPAVRATGGNGLKEDAPWWRTDELIVPTRTSTMNTSFLTVFCCMVLFFTY